MIRLYFHEIVILDQLFKKKTHIFHCVQNFSIAHVEGITNYKVVFFLHMFNDVDNLG